MKMKNVKIYGLSVLNKIIHLQFNLRFYYFVKLQRKLKFFKVSNSNEILKPTIEHNLKSLKQRNSRMNGLIKPLKAIELLNDESKILVIGPRNENDLFLLSMDGFKNVIGIDLISYSPLIQLGDMHELTAYFETSFFDVVLCGWTLSYSTNPEKVISEIVSVVKPNGIIGIGVEYAIDDPSLDFEWKKLDGYVLTERDKLRDRINSVTQLKNLIGENLGDIYFQHDAPLKNAHLPHLMVDKPSSVCLICSVLK